MQEREGLEAGAISLVRGDPFYQAQRALGLIPRRGSGVVRRAVFYALVTWLPIAVWAWFAGRALPDAPGEPLLEHFGVTVRCLFAIPLLVLSEAMLHERTSRLIPHFLESGLVPDAERARFVSILNGVVRLRDATLPWIAIAVLIAAWMLLPAPAPSAHEIVWASEEGSGSGSGFGFGGLWFLYVARPLYVVLLVAWIWRLTLLFLLMRRIAALDLSLVPTHPDRAGGLGFVGKLPGAFSLVVLAISAVISSRLAHEVVYHEMPVASLRAPGLILVGGLTIAFLLPFLAFGGPLRRAKRRALLEYGTLVAKHGRLVRGRWILGQEPADSSLLAAPEIGPVADTIPLYEAVSRMRGNPLDRGALLSIALPAALPLLVVAAIKVPIKDILMKLVKAAL